MLSQLLLQCFYSLMEPVVRVKARKEDLSILQESIKVAQVEFSKIMKVEVIIEPENIVCMGGVICGSSNWNLQCNNTLDERLSMLKEMVNQFNTRCFQTFELTCLVPLPIVNSLHKHLSFQYHL